MVVVVVKGPETRGVPQTTPTVEGNRKCPYTPAHTLVGVGPIPSPGTCDVGTVLSTHDLDLLLLSHPTHVKSPTIETPPTLSPTLGRSRPSVPTGLSRGTRKNSSGKIRSPRSYEMTGKVETSETNGKTLYPYHGLRSFGRHI